MHFDVFRFKFKDPWSRQAMAKGGEQMDLVQARLGHSNSILLTWVDHHFRKRHTLDALWPSAKNSFTMLPVELKQVLFAGQIATRSNSG